MAGTRIIAQVQRLRSMIAWGLESDKGTADLTAEEVRVAHQVVTLAQLNAGQVITQMPAVAGRRYGIAWFIIKMNGAFTTATDIRLSSTEASPTDIVTIGIAQATDNATHAKGIGTNTLNDDALLPRASLAAGAGVQLRKTGSAAAGGTDVEVIIFYRITA